MAKLHRDDILFSVIGLGAFLILAGAAGAIRMRLAYWYLDNCGTNPWCRTVDLATSYWWAAFLPLVLGVAVLINRSYQARLKLRSPPEN